MDDNSHKENMADNEHTARQPAQAPPLFAKLPAELRLKIYEEIFVGSKTTYKQRLEVGDRTYRNILLPTNHCNFLLTCRQAYNEAQETYWRNTILYGDSDDPQLLFFLRSVVPGPAKLHIKHIRCLRTSRLLQQARSVRRCLEEFKNLQTIGFMAAWTLNEPCMTLGGSIIAPPNLMGSTFEEQAEERLKKFEAQRIDPLIYGNGSAVICRLLFHRTFYYMQDSERGEPIETILEEVRKMCFYNFNTGKIFFADDPDHIQDEEACFAMVLDN